MLGEVLLRSGALPAALQELKCAVALEPYSGSARRLLGVVLLRLHRPTAALDELILAVDLDPDDGIAWRLCGEVLMRLRRYEEAEFYVRRALSLDPSSPDATATLGFLYLHRGDPVSALETFDNALTMQPGHSRALDGRLHAKLMTEQAWTFPDSGAPAFS
jgi:Flp pilus assembly protein TadD